MPRLKASPPERAHYVDVHVGTRIRDGRKASKITQTELAKALGITFQQVQKYERGANRISASKLCEAAQVLGAPIAWFFEGLENQGVAACASPQNEIRMFLNSNEGYDLGEAFLAIPTSRLREQVQNLMLAMGTS